MESLAASWMERGPPSRRGVEAAGLSAGAEVIVEHLRGLAELGRGHVVDRAAEVRVVEDVEEIASELKANSLSQAELAARGDVPLGGAEAAEGVASEVRLFVVELL